MITNYMFAVNKGYFEAEMGKRSEIKTLVYFEGEKKQFTLTADMHRVGDFSRILHITFANVHTQLLGVLPEEGSVPLIDKLVKNIFQPFHDQMYGHNPFSYQFLNELHYDNIGNQHFVKEGGKTVFFYMWDGAIPGEAFHRFKLPRIISTLQAQGRVLKEVLRRQPPKDTRG